MLVESILVASDGLITVLIPKKTNILILLNSLTEEKAEVNVRNASYLLVFLL